MSDTQACVFIAFIYVHVALFVCMFLFICSVCVCVEHDCVRWSVRSVFV